MSGRQNQSYNATTKAQPSLVAETAMDLHPNDQQYILIKDVQRVYKLGYTPSLDAYKAAGMPQTTNLDSGVTARQVRAAQTKYVQMALAQQPVAKGPQVAASQAKPQHQRRATTGPSAESQRPQQHQQSKPRIVRPQPSGTGSKSSGGDGSGGARGPGAAGSRNRRNDAKASAHPVPMGSKSLRIELEFEHGTGSIGFGSGETSGVPRDRVDGDHGSHKDHFYNDNKEVIC